MWRIWLVNYKPIKKGDNIMKTIYFHPNGYTQVPVTSLNDIIEYCASIGHRISNIEIDFRDGKYLVLTAFQGSYACIGYVDDIIY